MAQMVKNPHAIQETQGQSLGWKDPLEKGMATHSSVLAWRIPWTEELGELQSMGSERVRHSVAMSTKQTACIAEPLCCTPETNTILWITCTSIKKTHFESKKERGGNSRNVVWLTPHSLCGARSPGPRWRWEGRRVSRQFVFTFTLYSPPQFIAVRHSLPMASASDRRPALELRASDFPLCLCRPDSDSPVDLPSLSIKGSSVHLQLTFLRIDI